MPAALPAHLFSLAAPELYPTADLGFWEHEWSRHGTCARTITGLRPDYFEAVLKLHESYDLDVSPGASGVGWGGLGQGA